jgi:hypothetical protein
VRRFLEMLRLRSIIIIIVVVVFVFVVVVIYVIIFMQGIYNIPATNHVSRVCNVAAVLYLQFVLHVMLFHM